MTLKPLYVSFVSLLLSSFSFAQGTLKAEFLDHKYPLFTEGAIQQNNIKSVTIREMYKPSGRPVYDQNIRFNYYFDRAGRLIGYQKTFPGYGGRVDTVALSRTYSGDFIVQETEKLGKYQRRTVYQDRGNDLIEQIISVKRGAMDWQEINREQIETRAIKDGEVILTGGLNSEPYHRVVTMKNDFGQKISREVWNGSRIQSIEFWEYDQTELSLYRFKDLLDHRNVSFTRPTAVDEDNGSFCENSMCKTWSIVWHSNGLPKGWIFFDAKTQNVDIWEFDYKTW